MNVWRFAAIVAAWCVAAVLLAIFTMAAYLGDVGSLTAGDVLELLLLMLYFVGQIFTIVTFIYYWFRLVRARLTKSTYAPDHLASDNASDLRGICVSVVLGLITAIFGHLVIGNT